MFDVDIQEIIRLSAILAVSVTFAPYLIGMIFNFFIRIMGSR